jgi:hypothetical protein
MTAIAELTAALGPDLVRTGDAIPARNHHDASGYAPTAPLAVVMPRTTRWRCKAA